MTEVQKLQAELNEFNANRKANIKENKVIADDFPTIRKPYTYKRSGQL